MQKLLLVYYHSENCATSRTWKILPNMVLVGTKAQAPRDLEPILRRPYKNEIRTTDPTGLDAWYLAKKELNKEKIKQNETKRTRLVLKPR